MVAFGDFSVQLVDADCKLPFTEHHYHDGKTYFEIPSDQEYLISISKPHAKLFSGTVLVRMYVNSAYLGFNLTYAAATKYTTPKYKGHWKRENGISTDTPIKCVEPPSKEAVKEAKKPALGKVKIKVFPTVADVVVPPKNEEMDRCCGGNITTPEEESVTKLGKVRYNKDCLLSTVTLYYGTRQALVQQGVIPADPHSDSVQTNNNSKVSSSVDSKGAIKDGTISNTDGSNTPKRRSKLSRVSTPPSSVGEVGRRGNKPTSNTAALDPTEADDSDSDDGSIVFVDPDMDVIALD
eukprot:scaffold353_cov185-Amphora_coffeaeformis.AAC.45